MTRNLASYSLPQLQQLSTRIAKEIIKRELAIKAATLKKLEKLAREHGLSLNEVLGDLAMATPRKAPAAKEPLAPKPALPVKFRHPSKSDLAWSGRGRKPQWVETWLANGGALDALATAAGKFEKKQARKTSLSQVSAPASTLMPTPDAEPTVPVNAAE